MFPAIVIASYNQADFLPDAIESALDQKIKAREIIIVDDGSTDGSLEIARKYQKDRPDKIRVISQVNKGLASARNTGLMNLSDFSSWVLFLDADDMLAEDAIPYLWNEVLCPSCEFDIIAPSFKTFGTSNQEIILTANPKLEDFKDGNKIGYCALIRKSALLEVGGYSPRMVEGYEDLHLWCNLLARGKKIITTPEVLWLYRTKEKSMWKDITPEIHKKLLNQINKDVPEAQLNF